MRRWRMILVATLALCAVPTFAQLLTDFEGYTLGANGQVMFRVPNLSGSTSGFLETSPNLSQINNEQALSGTQSLKVSFQFKANQTNPWLRLTTFNATILPNPIIPTTMPLSLWVYVPAGTPRLSFDVGRTRNQPHRQYR
ncbi:MAG: hypothetical protein KatS3mg022_2968 [Armatimonadota bacterium]|nr:MAG: hypothetical protein KatS3mg022_2968 [Armatimonadota bacterium]